MTAQTARKNGRAGANGHAPPPAPPPPAVVPIPLDRVRPSPLNPRKHIDEASLADLAASIRSVGLLELAAASAEPAAAMSPDLAVLLGRLAPVLAGLLGADACRRVAARRGLPGADSPRDAVRALAVSPLSFPELMALVAELVAARVSLEWSSPYAGPHPAADLAWWGLWGIDPARLRREAGLARKAKAGKKGGLKVAGGDEGEETES